MKKICYILEADEGTAAALNYIEKTFPVFTELDLLENGYLEVTFVCREEDVRAIQVFLAAYV